MARLAILRLDGDMFESTLQCFQALYQRVAARGFVIIDDYFLPSCHQTVDEFRRRNGIVDPLIDIDGMAVFWQRT